VLLCKIVPLSYSCTVKVSFEQPHLSFSLLWINLAFLNCIQHIHVLAYLGILILQILYIEDVSCSCMYLFICFNIILADSGVITFKDLISLQRKSYCFRYLKWKLVNIWLNLRNYTPTGKRGHTAVTMSVCCPFVYKQLVSATTGQTNFIFDTQLWPDNLKVFLYFHFCWVSIFVWLSCSNLKRVGVSSAWHCVQPLISLLYFFSAYMYVFFI
jgi:hypothetical protein